MKLDSLVIFFVLYSDFSDIFIGSEIITTNPYAVTPSFEGLEDLYLRLRNPNGCFMVLHDLKTCITYQQIWMNRSMRKKILKHLRDPSPESHLTPEMKWQICKNIFVKLEHIVDPLARKYEILLNPAREQNWFRNNRKDIFDDVFEKPQRSSLRMCLPGTATRDYCLVNRSRLRQIVVRGENRQENVFECQTVDREHHLEERPYRRDDPPYSWPSSTIRIIDHREHVKRYFVSDTAYNVNEVPGAEHVVGRFVFYYDDIRQKLIVLHALAEESPPLFRTNKKEHYLERRNGYSPAMNELDDPLCRLDPGRKLRICNAVLFERKRENGAEVQLIEERCEKLSFSLKGESEEIQYSEWMMKCGFASGTDVVTSYVSRAYIDSEVFVHVTTGVHTSLRLCGYKNKIAVLSDRPTVTESRSHRAVELGESSELVAEFNIDNDQNN